MELGQELWVGGERLGTLLEDVPCEIEITRDGVGRTTLFYQCFFSKATKLVKEVRTHPVYTWLTLSKASISREEAGMARVRIDYEGVDPSEASYDDEEDRTIYGLESSESTEPIETHPKFTEFAGDWKNKATWRNGAKFAVEGDEAGRFRGFITPAEDDAEHPKTGMRSFYDGGIIYTQTKTYPHQNADTVAVDMNKLYEIDAPPPSQILPKVSSKRNWLLVGCSVRQVGRGMQVTKRWRLSGRNGWDPDVYRS